MIAPASILDSPRDAERVRIGARKRLSICYAAPGQNLLPTAGPTRNVLSVAEALSEWADVTVAFRTVLVPVESRNYQIIGIDPATGPQGSRRDDTATRGFHPVRHLAYCRRLQAFARECAGRYDVVLEKGWRLSGFLSACCGRVGVPAALVENTVSLWLDPVNDLRELGKYLLHRAAVGVTNSCSRRIPVVIAETEQLKAQLVSHRGVPAERIPVIGLGVDHRVFRPMDQQRARDALGIDRGRLVLLYVGGIDEYHDLEPVIDALGRTGREIELHVVGDGEYRPRSEARASLAGIRSRFYGHVSHEAVPQYTAAADLCLAPYRTSAFHGGVVTFSTLKIPEYMACARPVISVPSPAIARLVTHGVNGFLLANEPSSWASFLAGMPSRERLAAMGRAAAAAVAPLRWEATAAGYLRVCERLLGWPPAT